MSRTKNLEALRIAAATAVLETGPDPVVELRVRRDILGNAASSAEIHSLEAKVDQSRWVRMLADEQRADGS